ncbi:MAG: polysaccharide biosynthesis tyrosine autokinase [Chthoniobacter sp.]|nr:polysaccharide biosynthesis tyrosine autokinase [Chthoniobacter sp.]
MNETNEAKLHFLDYWRVIKVRIGLILLTFFLVMVTAGVTTYFLPKQFLSKVRMEVKQDNSGPVSVFGGGNAKSFDPQFVATQFQILQTTEILYPVIERLDLAKAFAPVGQKLSPQQAFNRVRRSMQLQEVRNTGLIDIGIYDTDRDRAANIANTIGVVYVERRRADLQKNVDRGLEQLTEEVTKQRAAVLAASSEAARLRTEGGIPDPNPDEQSSLTGGGKETEVDFIEKDLSLQKSRVSTAKLQLELLQKLKPEELPQALRSMGIEDPTVTQTGRAIGEFSVEEKRLLSSGVGENHPRITSLRGQTAVYRSQLQIALNGQLSGIANTYALEKQKLEDATARVEVAKQAQVAEKTRIKDYIDAKNRYLQERRILETSEINLKAERMKRGIEMDPARIWEKAEPSVAPAKPNVPMYMLAAAALGLFVGIGLAFFIEYLDTSVKTLDDVERFLQIPVLAVIPKDISVLMQTTGDSPDAEAYRILRAAVEFNKPHRDANTFTLISGGPGEGKSTTMNNLAYTCAKGGYNVLVVDADLRRATQHKLFGVSNEFGLTDYLLGRAEIDEVIKTTKIDNLSFIPAGELPADSVGILNSQRMTDLIAKVKQQYDLVFFDSPPILGVSDGAVLASEVDVTIMVVQHRRFPRAMLQRVKQAVLGVGGRLIGVVLNNVDSKHDDGYSYYNSYNEYYGARREAPRIETAAPQLARPRPSSREDY